jgi:hypothetical protein
MLTRRKMWQMLSSLPLIAAITNRAAVAAPAAAAPSPTGGPGRKRPVNAGSAQRRDCPGRAHQRSGDAHLRQVRLAVAVVPDVGAS